MDTIIPALREGATHWVPRVAIVVLIFVVFLILAKIIKTIIRNSAKRLKLDGTLTSLFARTSSITLIIFGVVTALGTLGVDVSALVAGLGLTGFAIGFALKDTISNLLSGVLILLYRPFEIGNRSNTIRPSPRETKRAFARKDRQLPLTTPCNPPG